MVLLVLIAGLAGWCAHDYWARLGDAGWKARFWPWLLQGFLFPCMVWGVANIGFGDQFPALVPQIADAQDQNRPSFWLWTGWTIVGGLFIAVHWTAITYLWLLGFISRAAEDKREFALSSLIIGAVSFTIAGTAVYFLGWIHTGAGLCLALLPIVHFTMDLAEKPPPKPSYDRAIGQLKFGKYNAAEWEVISQLEKSENDFDGWMLLAELYATQYRRLDDAARVVFDVCHQPETQPYQISLACHKLADWQLEVAANPLGARAALELLARKVPGSHFARMAEQRLKQIPATVEEFDQSKKPKRIRLPALPEDLDATPATTVTAFNDAVAEANRLSDKLRADPNDISAREQLATVLAESVQKVDLAVRQLELLIELPAASEEQKAKWSARIANWQFKEDADQQKYRAALHAIISNYPETATAFGAQRRLNLMAERHAIALARPADAA